MNALACGPQARALLRSHSGRQTVTPFTNAAQRRGSRAGAAAGASYARGHSSLRSPAPLAAPAGRAATVSCNAAAGAKDGEKMVIAITGALAIH
jgi:hypothetical protein